MELIESLYIFITLTLIIIFIRLLNKYYKGDLSPLFWGDTEENNTEIQIIRDTIIKCTIFYIICLLYNYWFNSLIESMKDGVL